MTEEELKNKELCDKYPFLKKYDWTDNFLGYETTWQDNLPEGWKKAMCPQIWDELKQILVDANYLEEFRFVDIKEKFGVLRLGYSGLEDKYMKRFGRWESKYEEMSTYSCIDCGEEVDYMRLNWISYYCRDCAIRLCNEQRKIGLREVFIRVQDLKKYDKASKEDRKKYWISFTEEGEEYYVNK